MTLARGGARSQFGHSGGAQRANSHRDAVQKIAAGNTASHAELAHALSARLGLRLVLVYVVDGIPPGTQESLTARQRLAGAERALDVIARDIGNGPEKRLVLGRRAEALAQVAAEERRSVQILQRRCQAADHPVSVGCLESDYLKCLISRVE